MVYGSGDPDIDTGLPMGLSLNVANTAKYQWQKHGASNEKQMGRLPFQSEILRPHHRSGAVSGAISAFTSFDWGSDLGDDPNRTSNSASLPAISARDADKRRLLGRLRVTSITADSGRNGAKTELGRRRFQREIYRLGRLRSWVAGLARRPEVALWLDTSRAHAAMRRQSRPLHITLRRCHQPKTDLSQSRPALVPPDRAEW